MLALVPPEAADIFPRTASISIVRNPKRRIVSIFLTTALQGSTDALPGLLSASNSLMVGSLQLYRFCSFINSLQYSIPRFDPFEGLVDAEAVCPWLLFPPALCSTSYGQTTPLASTPVEDSMPDLSGVTRSFASRPCMASVISLTTNLSFGDGSWAEVHAADMARAKFSLPTMLSTSGAGGDEDQFEDEALDISLAVLSTVSDRGFGRCGDSVWRRRPSSACSWTLLGERMHRLTEL